MERFLIPVLKASFHDWLLVGPCGSLDHLREAWVEERCSLCVLGPMASFRDPPQ